jgi:hypothetical protein
MNSSKQLCSNLCVSWLCPSPGILNNWNTQRLGNWIFFRRQVRLGPFTSFYGSQNRLDVFYQLIWRRKQIQFPKRCVFYILEFGTIDTVQKPSHSAGCTSSSEPLKSTGNCLIKELAAEQLANKLTSFYGTRRLIAVFREAPRHWTMNWTRWFHATHFRLSSLRTISALSLSLPRKPMNS